MTQPDILFQITKDQLETGLRGVPVGYCTTSYVDPEKGLFYVGRPVAELSVKEPQEVIYLLYFGKEGTPSEVASFYKELKEKSVCPPSVIEHIYSLPKKGHPMKLFSAALLILGMLDGQGDYKKDCINLIAKIPHLVAAVINYHAGWGETKEPNLDLGYMESFVEMLNVPHKNKQELTPVFKLFNILHYDHGGGNLSTFVGKTVASGLEDMYGSICSAMCALAGPRHGKANQDCLEFVRKVLSQLGPDASEEEMEALIRHKLASKELVFGFGHAVLRVEDPRATVFYGYAQKHFPHHPLVKMASLLRSAGSKVLAENLKVADPHPNIDAVSGTVLAAAGFDYPQYFTVLFGLARCVGISIQIVYERTEAREGKGTPIIRPKYLYKPR